MSSAVRMKQLLAATRGDTLSGVGGLPAGVTAVNSVTLTGTGTPEGIVAAPIGTQYINKTGGAATTLYIKTSGTTAAGWTAK